MRWTHALTGSYLTRERTGAPKPAPTLWLPRERRLVIPRAGQDHARPVILLCGAGATPAFCLVLYPDRIEGQVAGRRRTLVQL